MTELAFLFISTAATACVIAALSLPILRPAQIAGGMAGSPRWRFAAVIFTGLAPLAVLLLYGAIGSPRLIDPPPPAAAAIAALPEAERQAAIEGMVASLAARLAEEPEDADGWRMLARSQFALGRFAESADSYRRLFTVEEGGLADWKNYAGALAAEAQEAFPTSPAFIAALDRIEALSPGDPYALFYRGGAALGSGEPARAAELWTRLLGDLPADAPVRGQLEGMIEEAEAAGNE